MRALTLVRKTWIDISEQPLLAGGIIGALTLSICIFMAILNPPLPVVHDEYSYLLAADTFLHGRLANPPHPMWVFFESFHINMLPMYVSKYPPMQGFALALGLLISGQAIVGVWISLAVGCIAVYWMLRGWIAPGWALLGGLMVSLNGDLIITWGQTYWGGAMAMLGGALLYGSIVRLVKRPRLLEAVLCGIGITILAMSRPYEGMVASIPAAGYLFYGLYRNKEFSWKKKITSVLLPIGLLLILMVSFMGYYNYQTTGDAAKFAYTVNSETYAATPTFFFLDARPVPEYRHDIFKMVYVDYALGTYMFLQSFPNFFQWQIASFNVYWSFYSPFLFSIFVLGLPLALKEKSFRFIFFTCLFFGSCMLLIIPIRAHYAAPFTAAIVLAIVGGLRPIWNWELRGKKIGNVIIVAVIILSVFQSFKTGMSYHQNREAYSNRNRNKIADELQTKGGNHLVFVRYFKNHSIHDEWVWNSAEIDEQQVVWARYMNEKANQTLIDYYKDRKVHLLITYEEKPYLISYPK